MPAILGGLPTRCTHDAILEGKGRSGGNAASNASAASPDRVTFVPLSSTAAGRRGKVQSAGRARWFFPHPAAVTPVRRGPLAPQGMMRILFGVYVGRLVSAQVMPPDKDELPGVVKGWVGNTWDGAEGGVTNQSQWVPISMDGFFVKEDDGSLYGATMWDEGGHESSAWSANGDMLGACVDTHGWARGGGQDIAADDQFVYSSQRQAPCGDGVSAGDGLQAGPCTWVGGPVSSHKQCIHTEKTKRIL